MRSHPFGRVRVWGGRAVRLAAMTAASAMAWPPGAFAATGPPPRRSVLYPRAEVTIRFDHTEHRGITCGSCHGAVEQSISAREQHPVREAACRRCHAKATRDRDDIQRASGGKRCALCHVGFDGRGRPAQRIPPTARIHFSHRMHAERGVPCASCHRFGAGGRALPLMADCIGCHLARKVGAAKGAGRCQACHLTNKDNRLVTRFADQRLAPRDGLRGDAHTILFARNHAQAARAQRRYCETCHTPRDCLSCHAGRLKPMSLHGSDYVTHHALDARRNEPRCSSCHRSQTFCLSCHERTGVSPTSRQGGFRPSTGVSFHPPGFNAPRLGPGHHAYAARRNLAQCSSCHTEQTCTGCHASRYRSGGGFSPHEPGFGRSAKCRALAGRNPRVCLKCHASTDVAVRCR